MAAAAKQPSLARAVLVTGKGGVGKTTVAAALAMASVQRGQPAVLVEFGDGLSGTRALGAKPRRLEHIAIESEQAFVRAAKPLLGSGLLTRLVLGNFAVRRLLRAGPALREISMMESVRQIVEEHPKARVVVDMPATGHLLAWLRVAGQLVAVSSPSPFRSMAAKVQTELLAPDRCSVVVVTLPERMVLHETLELCAQMEAEVGLRPAHLVVNQVPPAVGDEARSAAQAWIAKRRPYAEAARELLSVIELRQSARAEAMSALHEVLGERGLRPILLPAAPADPAATQVAGWLEQEGVS